MMDLLISLNALANGCGRYLLQPIGILPGWLSATLVAAGTGVIMLLLFKYTSHQQAIKRVRNRIKANLLALSLFKDSVIVSLRCQRRVLVGAGQLLGLSIIPMLVMTVPMCLLLTQLAIWYQVRPLHVGEETTLTVHLADQSSRIPELQFAPSPGAEVTLGPVRVPTKHMVCWNLRATTAGYHRVALTLQGQEFEKELAVGKGFMRVSERRPSRNWTDVVLHPRETPFSGDSIVQSIEIDYPERTGWITGSHSWLVYWFVASLATAFLARPLFHVNF